MTLGDIRLHDDDMLTVADAAVVARRSVRTIRRAYLSAKLVAHRDGNGRAVRIRSADLRAWLTAEVISPTPKPASLRSVKRVGIKKGAEGRAQTGNLELLAAARARRALAVRDASVDGREFTDGMSECFGCRGTGTVDPDEQPSRTISSDVTGSEDAGWSTRLHLGARWERSASPQVSNTEST